MKVKDIIQIQYFGSIRAAAQKSAEALEVSPETSIFQFLERLAETYGDVLRGELMAQGRLRDDLTISLNGAIIQHAAADEIILRPDDTVALFPLFPGGG